MKKEAIKMVQNGPIVRIEEIEDKTYTIHDIYGDIYACFGYYFNKTSITSDGNVKSNIYDVPAGDWI